MSCTSGCPQSVLRYGGQDGKGCSSLLWSLQDAPEYCALLTAATFKRSWHTRARTEDKEPQLLVKITSLKPELLNLGTTDICRPDILC